MSSEVTTSSACHRRIFQPVSPAARSRWWKSPRQDLQDSTLNAGTIRIRIKSTYFDEVTGTFSSETRYLDSLLLADQAGASNVNLYTHLQSGRIQTLMQQGQSFEDARSQAQQEWQARVGTQTPAGELDVLDGRSGSSESGSAGCHSGRFRG